MRNLFKLALLTALFVALTITPALAKKKAPVDRTIVDGVALAIVKPSTQMQPYYPASTRISDRHAEVIVSLQVLETGRVGDVEVLSASISDAGFEESAATAVKHWRFHPALKGGEAIETATLVRLTFGPPTLKSPDGFVFVETSPRNYAVAFMNTHTDRTLAEEFRNNTGNTESHVSARDRINSYDSVPCARTAGCIYDKREMSQFGGSPASSPHNHPTGGG
jgi:TonB family protein